MGQGSDWLDFGGIRYFVSNHVPADKIVVLSPEALRRSAENLQRAIIGVRAELVTHTPTKEKPGMQIAINCEFDITSIQEMYVVMSNVDRLVETLKEFGISGEVDVEPTGQLNVLMTEKKEDDIVLPF